MSPKIRRVAVVGVGAAALVAALVVLPSPASSAPGTMFGSTTNGAYLSTYAPVDHFRAFFPGAPGSNWSGDSRLNHGKPVNISFKFDADLAVTGQYDATVRAWFASIPEGRTVQWTYYHEPEDNIRDGEFTAANYRAAWARFREVSREPGLLRPGVQLSSALVLMDWTLDPGSGRNWRDYYPGADVIDTLAWDVYNFRETDSNPANDETIEQHLIRRPSLAVTQAEGKQYAISELGHNSAATRPAFLEGLARWAETNGVTWVDYFDLTGSLGDHRLHDAASQDVWRRAIAGEFAADVTPSPTSSPTPTVTPAATSAAALSVAMRTPTDGSTVQGTVIVDISSPQSSSLRLVRYFLDGVEIARDSTCCRWDEPWNTAGAVEGAHSLWAVASTSSQSATSAPVTVTVDNVPDPTPTPSPTPTPTDTPTPSPTPTPTETTPSPGDPVLVGAGDIAGSGSGDEATAVLLDSIPGTVYTTGDNAYDSGTTAEFNTYYDPTWGRHKARTRPSPGNHDYQTSGATGYFGYFGAAAGDPVQGYYSYDVGDWHVVVVNSNVARGAGSAQEQWVRADLAANPRACTVAYWHHPRFTSGANHSPDTSMGPIVQALYDGGTDVILTGHNHNYERFAPMNPAGQLDMVRGIRHFVVGTGGRSHYGFGTVQPNSEVRNSTAFGVLKLTMHTASYDWQFVPVAGQTFTDSGSESCR